MSTRDNCLFDSKDLTNDLRHDIDETWVVVRNLLNEKKIDVDDVILVAFKENEYGVEFGLLVTSESCYEFHRKYGELGFERWIEGFEKFDAFSDAFYLPYLQWAREFLETGEV